MRDYDLAALVGSEELVRRRLAREFPRIPPRIIASVLSAYRRTAPSLQAAARAARERLEDARAV
jgi:hypothetical protein